MVERERELADARSELRRLHDERHDRLREAAAVVAELEAVRRQARGQATRIRMRALRDAAELSDRVADLTSRPVESRERLLAALEQTIERIGAEEGEGEPVELPALRPAGDVFDGRIEIEVGPFEDFSQLVGFEDAACAIAATSQISVKRFARGRATLEMRLDEPVELLRELEERAPFEFSVRDRRADRLVLDVPGAEGS